MTIVDYLLLFGSVLSGGLAAYWLERRLSPQWLPLLLSFSGAYLLGISMLHLLPGIFHKGGGQAGMWLLGGFLIQLLLEPLSRGVEHGHIHAHQGAPAGFALQIMLGLCLHAFLEGTPLGAYDEFFLHNYGEHAEHNHLLYGIVLHKLPAAFALVALLRRSQFSDRFTLICLLVFASMSPLGSLLGSQFVQQADWLNNLMAVVVGSFLHIATTILFEADSKAQHAVSWHKLAIILLGFVVALLTVHF